MDINLTEILNSDGAEKKFCEKVGFEPINYMGFDFSFEDGLTTELTLKNEGGLIKVFGACSGVLCTKCARCLEDIKKDFEARIDETVIREGEEDISKEEAGEDVIVISGYMLPLDEIVANAVLVNLDVRYLCKDDCKGLCPECGKNLNEGKCPCKSEKIDPRLEVLSKLIDN